MINDHYYKIYPNPTEVCILKPDPGAHEGDRIVKSWLLKDFFTDRAKNEFLNYLDEEQYNQVYVEALQLR